MTKNPISEQGVRTAAAGDELATSALFVALQTQFSKTAQDFFKEPRDGHAAEEAIETAFLKALAHVRSSFAWQGEGQFCAFFKRVLASACIDALRRRRQERDWARGHLLSPYVVDAGGYEEDRVELAADPRGNDTRWLEGGERSARSAGALTAFRQSLSERDQDLLSAYSDLCDIPGSDQWPSHERTGFVKSRVGLDGNAFYVAHSRFRRRAESVVAELGFQLR
jgi:DNA-directed RNA polymerase specialized sigma24 family protein